jgi:hypothetical protein
MLGEGAVRTKEIQTGNLQSQLKIVRRDAVTFL